MFMDLKREKRGGRGEESLQAIRAEEGGKWQDLGKAVTCFTY